MSSASHRIVAGPRGWWGVPTKEPRCRNRSATSSSCSELSKLADPKSDPSSPDGPPLPRRLGMVRRRHHTRTHLGHATYGLEELDETRVDDDITLRPQRDLICCSRQPTPPQAPTRPPSQAACAPPSTTTSTPPEHEMSCLDSPQPFSQCLIFPHHECERAQSEAATGTTFVRHWMHCGMVAYEGTTKSTSSS